MTAFIHARTLLDIMEAAEKQLSKGNDIEDLSAFIEARKLKDQIAEFLSNKQYSYNLKIYG